MSVKRKADDAPPTADPKRCKGEEYPSQPLHYRWHCPEQRTDWLSNAVVCDHCVCYVCNLSLRRVCGVNSHKFAGPPEQTQWVEKRAMPDQLDLSTVVAGVETTHLAPMTTIEIPNFSLVGCERQLGIPPNLLRVYLQSASPEGVWRYLSDFQRSSYTHTTMEKLAAIGEASVSSGVSRIDIARLKKPVKVDLQGPIGSTFRLESNKLVVDVFMTPKINMMCAPTTALLRQVPSNPMPGFGIRVTTPPDSAPEDRPMLPYQIASLAQMEKIEIDGLTHLLWSRGPDMPDGRQTLLNPALGSFRVLEPGEPLPDGDCRGGLLCNQRGTGKTYISCALMAKRKAPQEWLDAPDGMDLDLELDDAPMTVEANAVSGTDTAKAPRKRRNTWGSSDSESDDDDDCQDQAVPPPPPTQVISTEPEIDDVARRLREHHAKKTTRVKTTLVVVPGSNLLDQWNEELERLNLSVIRYYGKSKVECPDEIGRYDVLLTTTDTLRRSLTDPNVPKLTDGCNQKSVFVKVRFWRAIIDECHKLLQNSTLNKSGQAMAWVRAHQQWGLTATPDISLGRVRLYAQFLYGVPTRASAENSHVHHFVRYPARYSGTGTLRDAYKSVFHTAFNIQEAAGELQLPEVKFELHAIAAPAKWKERYDEVYKRASELVMAGHGVAPLHLMNRLLMTTSGIGRMDMPTHAIMSTARAPLADNGDALVPPDIFDCAICLQKLDVPVRTKCTHYFCHECIVTWFRQSSSPRCPNCRAPGNEADLVRCMDVLDASASDVAPQAEPNDKEDIPEEETGLWACPTKLSAVVQDIVTLASQDNSRDQKTAERIPNRLLVFSRFPDERAEIIKRIRDVVSTTDSVKKFQTDDSIAVLVISPQSCGVGLNLMQANHVLLVNPMMRKSMEEQAYGRAARIGQRRTVHVHRYMVKGTIEQKLHENADNGKLNLKSLF